jgi:hypothetical protein
MRWREARLREGNGMKGEGERIVKSGKIRMQNGGNGPER